MADREPGEAAPMMPQCCIESFVSVGVARGFMVAKEGEQHQCPRCARIWRLVAGIWKQQKPH